MDGFEQVLDDKMFYKIILNNKKAIHLKAKKEFVDCCGIRRKVGEEWLLNFENCNSHLLEIEEKLLKVVDAVCLKQNEYCVLENNFGIQKIVKGPCSFFLSPQEKFKDEIEPIKQMILIEPGEALKLKSLQTNEEQKVGEIIYKYGPSSMILDEEKYELISKLRAKIRIDWFGMYFLYL